MTGLLSALAICPGVLCGVVALAVVIVFLIVPPISRPGRPPRNP